MRINRHTLRKRIHFLEKIIDIFPALCLYLRSSRFVAQRILVRVNDAQLQLYLFNSLNNKVVGGMLQYFPFVDTKPCWRYLYVDLNQSVVDKEAHVRLTRVLTLFLYTWVKARSSALKQQSVILVSPSILLRSLFRDK